MKKFILSEAADVDLEEIFDYTNREFGLDQAVSYVSAFDLSFYALLQKPEIGRERPEIREGLRSLVKDRHVIFYRVLEDHIRIVRVLHGSRDLPTFFD